MGEVRVPELGESIVEATVLRWLKELGSTVGQGEALAELETDKVNVEVISDEAGVLSAITKQAGDTVAVGEAIGIISAVNESGGALGTGQSDVGSGAGTNANGPNSSPSEPNIGAMAQVPFAKHAIQGASAQAAQTQSAQTQPEGAGGPGGVGGSTASPAPMHAPTNAPGNPTSVRAVAGLPASDISAPPSIRKMARERGLDLSQVNNPRDLMGAGSGSTTVNQGASAKPAAESTGDSTPAREERSKLSRRRLTIAKRLVETQQRAAMLTTFNEVDMSAVMEVRKRRKDKFRERHGVSLGFMSFFTKAVVGALKAFPLLNAEISGDDMIVKKHYDIGVAVSTDGGLVVPVVRDADRMNFAEIEQEIARLAKKARDNTLGLSDLQGGTFTITNGGVFGSLFSTPILNGTQVGILGMHGIMERPIAVNGQVEIRPMMYIALSYDHRIVDGAEAVQFLVRVKQLVEDPESLLIEG